jgi:uncharacterized membrane protein
MNNSARQRTWTHWLFMASILAKGSLGLIQIATSAAIFMGFVDRLPMLLQSVVASELAEDPNDFLAARLMTFANALPSTDMTFYTYYFAAHGILHVTVVAALIYGSLWAYPAAIAVLGIFVAYQIFEWVAVGGTMLLVLTAIDLIVIGLTFIEWKRRRSA